MRNVIQLCLALVFANNILLMRKRHYVFLILLLAIAVNACKMTERFASRRYSLKNKLGDRMIKQLLNSVIAKYLEFSVSRRSIIICLSLRLGQIIDLLAILLGEKTQYGTLHRAYITGALVTLFHEVHTDSSAIFEHG